MFTLFLLRIMAFLVATAIFASGLIGLAFGLKAPGLLLMLLGILSFVVTSRVEFQRNTPDE